MLFRKVCHFELGRDVPEASTLGWFLASSEASIIEGKVQSKSCRGKPLSKEERASNKEISVTREVGARFLLPIKRHCGFAKNETIYGLTAIAANIRKGAKFLVFHGVPKPCYVGL
ncbi:MAG: hypothetical protein QS748_09830 [Candidatus Endonucleobacter bathymodioli]|uniref:Uncharacterized protein n=1 Tax=Candidatus Endonucleibacter bathymodioli TaxID=539814 RepID=A0AA90SN10_9GAMM|nr:hypothetical protein [Candidatus Endonucleobacter bathymodioli]